MHQEVVQTFVIQLQFLGLTVVSFDFGRKISRGGDMWFVVGHFSGESSGLRRWQLALLLGCCLLLALPVRATELMLPQVYAGQVEVSGWLMSEKLDGLLRKLYT